ncbi:TetR/AcrR family transcriptional regulator [Echinimonas agarilytica]|uniref:TetR/AcrR family transcriptional regulator n=1 Tax=Echinimonas agarilytica TaxID=1215918 RepID=A0AA42B666_9GAMM|nr:TetR/AcrR family transcriptional regulator [Echinimonas agarilytica]MCM2678294.1 TetR/AcrR family transcriptional regulator [Echinimonas agarilytica]
MTDVNQSVSRRTRNMDEKRSRLLEAALALFSKHGVEHVTTSSIAKTAGVATGTLFHHFGNKEALVQALYLDIKADLARHIKPVHSAEIEMDELQTVWMNYLQWCASFPQQLRFVIQYSHSSAVNQVQREAVWKDLFCFVLSVIQKGQKQGFFAVIPEAMVIEVIEAMATSMGQYFMYHSDAPDALKIHSYKMLYASLAVK